MLSPKRGVLLSMTSALLLRFDSLFVASRTSHALICDASGDVAYLSYYRAQRFPYLRWNFLAAAVAAAVSGATVALRHRVPYPPAGG